MNTLRRLLSKLAVFGLFAAILPAGAFAQKLWPSTSGPYNYSPAAQTFTASAQTGTAIPLPAVDSALIQISGSSLSTVTWAIKCSNDGTNFYSLPTAAMPTTALPSTLAVTQTTTAAALYLVNVAGCMQVEFVTSGTFTATSVTIKFTGSPAKGLL